MNQRGNASRGALVGVASAAVVVALMFGLRLSAGVQALPDIAADAMTLILPGGVFAFFLQHLQQLGRPLLALGVVAGLLVLGALAGALAARLLARRALATRVAVPALALSALTVPFVFVGMQDERTLPTAVATAGYWLLFAALLAFGLSRVADERLLPAVRSPSRRIVLHGAAAVAGLWLAGYLGGRIEKAARFLAAPPLPTLPAPAPTPAAGGAAEPTDPFAGLRGITPTKDFYVISKNGVDDPNVDAGSWGLRIGGERPYTLGYDELRALPKNEAPRTLECVGNEIGGPLISTAIFAGVPLRDLLARAGLPTGTTEIRFGCADGYTESLELEVAKDPSTIVAWLMNGETLPKEHGFPARIIMSGRYGQKNPKWLTSIMPTAQPFFGYWEQRGWDKASVVLTMSRLDGPGAQTALVTGAPALIHGVAYAGARGVSQVEMSFDGGKTWREVQLRTFSLPKDAWVFFTHVWTPQAAGTYELLVRATDGDGAVQDATVRGTFPKGATGYHRVSVKVA